MNKTMKIALCISLVGIGVFVWTQVASAGKPLPPPTAPVVVTFLSGDVSAAPQALPGPFTATIDFLKYIPYICADSPLGVAGSEELLRMLQTKNPITYESLSITVSRKGTHTLNFNVKIDGVSYLLQMNLFNSDTTESTPMLDTIRLHEGRFAIGIGKKYIVFVGSPTKPVNLDFSMTK
ncbi:MAG: hypothetical protein ABIF19_08390 [Planctomycetota bacterium]